MWHCNLYLCFGEGPLLHVFCLQHFISHFYLARCFQLFSSATISCKKSVCKSSCKNLHASFFAWIFRGNPPYCMQFTHVQVLQCPWPVLHSSTYIQYGYLFWLTICVKLLHAQCLICMGLYGNLTIQCFSFSLNTSKLAKLWTEIKHPCPSISGKFWKK